MSQQINLYNPAFGKQQIHLCFKTILQGLSVVLVVLLMVYGYALQQNSQLVQRAVKVEQELNTARQAMASYAASYSPKQAEALLKNELQQLEKKSADTVVLVEALRSVGDSTGYSAYLRAFSRQVVPGLWLTAFTINGQQVDLSGDAMTAELVPGYIQNLAGEAVMQGKTFETLQIKKAKEAKYLEFILHSKQEVKP